MKSNKIDMTKGNLWTQILFFSIPLIISNILQILFNLSDVAVVGKFSGSDSLGAVGSTTICTTIFLGFALGVGNGINTCVAKYIGAKDEEKVKSTIHTGILMSLLIGILVCVIGVIFARNLLILIDTHPELLQKAVLYLRIYILGTPALTLYNYGNAIYSAKGNTKKPLIYLLISGILNVCLNLLFVIVFKMDVLGVALASIISQYFSAFLVLFSLTKEKDICRLSIKNIHMDKNRNMEILKIALPAAMQYAIFAIANLFIQSAVNSFDKIMIEGNTAASNADSLVYDVMAAFYMGCASFISQNYGAQNKKRILSSYFIALIYSLGIGLLMGITLVLLGKQFLSLFTNDKEVIECGLKRLIIMGFSYGFSSFMDNTLAASRGLGKTLIPTIIVILGSCVFRIIWVYTVFAYFKTISSLYSLYIVSWLLTGLFECIYFTIIYKKTTKSFC